MKTVFVKILLMLMVFVGTSKVIIAQTVNSRAQHTAVKSLVASKMPVGIKFLTVTELENKPLLTYSIVNKGKQELSAVNISVVVFKPTGEAKGGEGWRQPLSLARDASADFSVSLKTEVLPEDRVVFLINKTEEQGGQWETDPTKIIAAAKTFIAGDDYSLPKARFTKTK